MDGTKTKTKRPNMPSLLFGKIIRNQLGQRKEFQNGWIPPRYIADQLRLSLPLFVGIFRLLVLVSAAVGISGDQYQDNAISAIVLSHRNK